MSGDWVVLTINSTTAGTCRVPAWVTSAPGLVVNAHLEEDGSTDPGLRDMWALTHERTGLAIAEGEFGNLMNLAESITEIDWTVKQAELLKSNALAVVQSHVAEHDCWMARGNHVKSDA